jgi:hypothetical protein
MVQTVKLQKTAQRKRSPKKRKFPQSGHPDGENNLPQFVVTVPRDCCDSRNLFLKLKNHRQNVPSPDLKGLLIKAITAVEKLQFRIVSTCR